MRNTITNGAEFNQERELRQGRKWLPWGGSHETGEFPRVWSDLINPTLRMGAPTRYLFEEAPSHNVQ